MNFGTRDSCNVLLHKQLGKSFMTYLKILKIKSLRTLIAGFYGWLIGHNNCKFSELKREGDSKSVYLL
jgi:hypothetical protein